MKKIHCFLIVLLITTFSSHVFAEVRTIQELTDRQDRLVEMVINLSESLDITKYELRKERDANNKKDLQIASLTNQVASIQQAINNIKKSIDVLSEVRHVVREESIIMREAVNTVNDKVAANIEEMKLMKEVMDRLFEAHDARICSAEIAICGNKKIIKDNQEIIHNNRVCISENELSLTKMYEATNARVKLIQQKLSEEIKGTKEIQEALKNMHEVQNYQIDKIKDELKKLSNKK